MSITLTLVQLLGAGQIDRMEIKGCPMFVTEAAYVNERVVDAASIVLTIYGNFTK